MITEEYIQGMGLKSGDPVEITGVQEVDGRRISYWAYGGFMGSRSQGTIRIAPLIAVDLDKRLVGGGRDLVFHLETIEEIKPLENK